jgi:hypothetical protein
MIEPEPGTGPLEGTLCPDLIRASAPWSRNPTKARKVPIAGPGAVER